jgi:hypothetical protein
VLVVEVSFLCVCVCVRVCVSVVEIFGFTNNSYERKSSMAYNETAVIMRVLKCTVNMRVLYIVKLFGNSESLSVCLFLITSN